ncbi:TetR/AcrR family transcriptional regulator [Cellulomonas triticagri]|uniref:TetR/AcrR family transcriptional regulator n=1 Tax=Cellulomonas triticagri TaxID=2483352 RepID=A0A3M2J065_9CELL|nr:TetR/AcrR family transcriptional regulator [Cellulomonas triticagri]RMI04853.1 TetR/AcrR family transcriptional regulator [Cellulomonas triticagri]
MTARPTARTDAAPSVGAPAAPGPDVPTPGTPAPRAARPGRPRSDADRDTRGAVLAAAAELFSSVGYTATSTYAVAERAGVRQASIYHHFRGKDALLRTLLLDTVRPSLALADQLLDEPGSPAARLWALCDADAHWLAAGPVNIGGLMLLPEVAGESFAEFRSERRELRERYEALVAAVLGVPADPAPLAATLVFGLVESVITARSAGGTEAVGSLAPLVADAALRVLGLDDAAVARARESAADLGPGPLLLDEADAPDPGPV